MTERPSSLRTRRARADLAIGDAGKKGGGSGTLNSFPEAAPDPYDTLRYTLLDEKKKKKKSLGALSDRTAFVPASFGRSKCTPSVFTMNIRV